MLLVCSALERALYLRLLTVLAHPDRLRAGQLRLTLRRGEVRRGYRLYVTSRRHEWLLSVVRRRELSIDAISIVRVWLLHI